MSFSAPVKPPLWKKLLSYLTEIHIESAPSEINPHLYVSLSKGRYQLCTANAIYSFEDLYGNFRLAFQHLNWDALCGNRVLILGFGLGSIPLMLERVFQKDHLDFTVVEYDENVMYLAQKYIMGGLTSHFEINISDAYVFVNQCTERFDLICMDVFVDDEIPVNMENIEFLHQLKERLSDEGILLFNRLSRTKEDVFYSQIYLDEIFLKVFPEGGYLNARGNWILTNQASNFAR